MQPLARPTISRITVALLFLALTTWATGSVSAQSISTDAIGQLTRQRLPTALDELTEFLAIPNDGNYPAQVEANLAWCRERFTGLGFEVTRLETPGMPLLFARRTADPGSRR